MGIISITSPRSRSMEGMRVFRDAAVRGFGVARGVAIAVVMYENR
jgi:hypothetical protein